ncbi:pentapeptide repeat-containing protein [Streptomyces sp. NBC_00015]|uniref:pentapeptide repeat-containing protein n=1 Tax=unclassified Streptomyces TaxID=2593676 RepID=UPI00225ABB93|nr:pentapeptide repeat-containing protein [Streptomyces sp. NBC_00103]MCX5374772.1 pentapeptide repeat-containing protein [Streptomyces sp. NBC_00103]
MTDSRGPRSAPQDRELRLWKIGRALTVTFAVAVLAAGIVFYSLVALLDIREIDSTAKLDANTLFDLVKLSFGVVAGAGALVALVVAYRRQRVDEAGAHRDATRLHTERFTTAVSQIGDASPAVRLGGVHALAGLADDAPDGSLRQTCIDVLCAYLQLPFTPDPGADPAHQEEHHRYLALRKVRHTVLRLIGDHYRRPQETQRSWQGCDLDLTGVTVDGDLNFNGATLAGGTVSFDGAVFNDGAVSFDGAVFNGGAVSFDGAVFNGGTVSFDRAAFCGSEVSFNRAEFSAGTVSFRGAKCWDGEMSFSGAVFSAGTVSFADAVFSCDKRPFGGIKVSFGGAVFSGGEVSFHSAAFSHGRESFGGAVFSGGAVSFSHAVFHGGRELFRHAVFSGGEVSFHSAEFSRGRESFGGAVFSGGTVSFNEARGPAPDGLLVAVGTPVPATVTLPLIWLSPNP